VHEPAAGVPRIEHRRAQRRGVLDAVANEGAVDARMRIEAPNSGANLRYRRKRGLRERLAVRADHLYGVARGGIALDVRDRAGKNPRMTVPQRLVAAGRQPQYRSDTMPQLRRRVAFLRVLRVLRVER